MNQNGATRLAAVSPRLVANVLEIQGPSVDDLSWTKKGQEGGRSSRSRRTLGTKKTQKTVKRKIRSSRTYSVSSAKRNTLRDGESLDKPSFRFDENPHGSD